MTTHQVFEGETWFLEQHAPGVGIQMKIKEYVVSKRSSYQLIEVFDTYSYGRVLTLDRLIMLTERDECAYHEMLVHTPLLIHPHPKRVLVIGGGDGGSLREILKHPGVGRAVQVEIDGDVVAVCRQCFSWAAPTFDHPKVELIIEDAIKYIETVRDPFDVIVIDSSDPVGPAVGLFREQFFHNVFDALTAEGVMSCQLGSPFFKGREIGQYLRMLKKMFPYAELYLAHTPAYPAGLWGFGLASKKYRYDSFMDDERYRTLNGTLKYYNPAVHRAAFVLPEYIRRELESLERR